MRQVAHGHRDKQIKFDKATGKFTMPDKETEQEFKDFAGNANLVNQTLKNVSSEIFGEVSDALGMSPLEVVGAVGGATLGLGGSALGKQLGLFKNKSVVNKTNDEPNNATTNHVDPQHSNSFSDDIRNYTEEYGVSKGKFNAEARNLEGLEAQRANLKDGDTRASRLDNQIAESKKTMAEYKHDMDLADRNIKATKARASIAAEPKVNPSGGWKSILARTGLSFAAIEILDNTNETFGRVIETAFAAMTPVFSALQGQELGAGSDIINPPTSKGGSSSNQQQSVISTEQTQQFEQIKTEMSQNATSANAKTAQINSQVGNTRMMIEDLGDSIQEDFAKKLDEMNDKMGSINKKLTK